MTKNNPESGDYPFFTIGDLNLSVSGDQPKGVQKRLRFGSITPDSSLAPSSVVDHSILSTDLNKITTGAMADVTRYLSDTRKLDPTLKGVEKGQDQRINDIGKKLGRESVFVDGEDVSEGSIAFRINGEAGQFARGQQQLVAYLENKGFKISEEDFVQLQRKVCVDNGKDRMEVELVDADIIEQEMKEYVEDLEARYNYLVMRDWKGDKVYCFTVNGKDECTATKGDLKRYSNITEQQISKIGPEESVEVVTIKGEKQRLEFLALPRLIERMREDHEGRVEELQWLYKDFTGIDIRSQDVYAYELNGNSYISEHSKLTPDILEEYQKCGQDIPQEDIDNLRNGNTQAEPVGLEYAVREWQGKQKQNIQDMIDELNRGDCTDLEDLTLKQQKEQLQQELKEHYAKLIQETEKDLSGQTVTIDLNKMDLDKLKEDWRRVEEEQKKQISYINEIEDRASDYHIDEFYFEVRRGSDEPEIRTSREIGDWGLLSSDQLDEVGGLEVGGTWRGDDITVKKLSWGEIAERLPLQKIKDIEENKIWQELDSKPIYEGSGPSYFGDTPPDGYSRVEDDQREKLIETEVQEQLKNFAIYRDPITGSYYATTDQNASADGNLEKVEVSDWYETAKELLVQRRAVEAFVIQQLENSRVYGDPVSRQIYFGTSAPASYTEEIKGQNRHDLIVEEINKLKQVAVVYEHEDRICMTGNPEFAKAYLRTDDLNGKEVKDWRYTLQRLQTERLKAGWLELSGDLLKLKEVYSCTVSEDGGKPQFKLVENVDQLVTSLSKPEQSAGNLAKIQANGPFTIEGTDGKSITITPLEGKQTEDALNTELSTAREKVSKLELELFGNTEKVYIFKYSIDDDHYGFCVADKRNPAKADLPELTDEQFADLEYLGLREQAEVLEEVLNGQKQDIIDHAQNLGLRDASHFQSIDKFPAVYQVSFQINGVGYSQIYAQPTMEMRHPGLADLAKKLKYGESSPYGSPNLEFNVKRLSVDEIYEELHSRSAERAKREQIKAIVAGEYQLSDKEEVFYRHKTRQNEVHAGSLGPGLNPADYQKVTDNIGRRMCREILLQQQLGQTEQDIARRTEESPEDILAERQQIYIRKHAQLLGIYGHELKDKDDKQVLNEYNEPVRIGGNSHLSEQVQMLFDREAGAAKWVENHFGSSLEKACGYIRRDKDNKEYYYHPDDLPALVRDLKQLQEASISGSLGWKSLDGLEQILEQLKPGGRSYQVGKIRRGSNKKSILKLYDPGISIERAVYTRAYEELKSIHKKDLDLLKRLSGKEIQDDDKDKCHYSISGTIINEKRQLILINTTKVAASIEEIEEYIKRKLPPEELHNDTVESLSSIAVGEFISYNSKKPNSPCRLTITKIDTHTARERTVDKKRAICKDLQNTQKIVGDYAIGKLDGKRAFCYSIELTDKTQTPKFSIPPIRIGSSPQEVASYLAKIDNSTIANSEAIAAAIKQVTLTRDSELTITIQEQEYIVKKIKASEVKKYLHDMQTNMEANIKKGVEEWYQSLWHRGSIHVGDIKNAASIQGFVVDQALMFVAVSREDSRNGKSPEAIIQEEFSSPKEIQALSHSESLQIMQDRSRRLDSPLKIIDVGKKRVKEELKARGFDVDDAKIELASSRQKAFEIWSKDGEKRFIGYNEKEAEIFLKKEFKAKDIRAAFDKLKTSTSAGDVKDFHHFPGNLRMRLQVDADAAENCTVVLPKNLVAYRAGDGSFVVTDIEDYDKTEEAESEYGKGKLVRDDKLTSDLAKIYPQGIPTVTSNNSPTTMLNLTSSDGDSESSSRDSTNDLGNVGMNVNAIDGLPDGTETNKFSGKSIDLSQRQSAIVV
jgi:hypothetical protein